MQILTGVGWVEVCQGWVLRSSSTANLHTAVLLLPQPTLWAARMRRAPVLSKLDHWGALKTLSPTTQVIWFNWFGCEAWGSGMFESSLMIPVWTKAENHFCSLWNWQWSSNLRWCQNLLQGFKYKLSPTSHSMDLTWDHKMWTFEKFPGNAAADGLQSHFENHWSRKNWAVDVQRWVANTPSWVDEMQWFLSSWI